MDDEELRPQAAVVRIGDTDVGRGVFVARDFTAGEEILRLRGRLIDFAATLAKGDRECDAFQIGPGCYLDLEPPAKFLNHSCDPNTGVRDVLRLVALREIKAGQEIRFDYSTTMDENHWELACLCGSPRCRGIIRDFKWLPSDWKLQLIRMEVVPEFIIMSELQAGRLTSEAIGRGAWTHSVHAPHHPGPCQPVVQPATGMNGVVGSDAGPAAEHDDHVHEGHALALRDQQRSENHQRKRGRPGDGPASRQV